MSTLERWTRRLTVALVPIWVAIAALAVIDGRAFVAAFAGFICAVNVMEVLDWRPKR